jgi:hypothetical protein
VPDRRRSSPKRRARPPAEPVEVETLHAHARVEPDPNRPGGRLLTLDDHEASYVDLDDPAHLEWPYVRRIGDVIDAFRPPGSAIDAVHLGGGACTLARYILATRPRSTNEVFEHDPGVLALAREHLGLRTSPRLRVRVLDAAEGLAKRPDASADLVVGDAFVRQVIPPSLTGPAATAELRRVLRPAGVHVLNVVDGRGLPLARELGRTLATDFAHVAAIAPRAIVRKRAGGNVILAASNEPLPIAALAQRAAASMDREEILPLR